MAESTLSSQYTDLQLEVGRFLGYGDDPDEWPTAEVTEVDRYIQAGVRQFYYPPAVEGVELGYEWSFLKPVTTLDTTADDGAQDMPDNFGRMAGDLHFAASVYAKSIPIVSEAQILSLLQRSTSTGQPQFAALRFKESDGSDGQRQEIVFWPIPNDAYTLTYRYEAYVGKLTETYKYVLGGMKYAEVVMESCLAIAEQRANDERGIHWESFARLLATAVAQDRKTGARHYGPMSRGEAAAMDPRHCRRQSSYVYTYNGNVI